MTSRIVELRRLTRIVRGQKLTVHVVLDASGRPHRIRLPPTIAEQLAACAELERLDRQGGADAPDDRPPDEEHW